MKALQEIDKNTWNHCVRVKECSVLIGNELQLSDEEKQILQQAALLHDVGKLLIPMSIVNKPGQLTGEEWQVMKKHPQYGASIIREEENYYSRMNETAKVIRYHHEHYDGFGYPEGIKGENIPILSRILTIIDIFDALISVRPYRKALRIEDTINIMEEMKGKQLDPRLTEIFIEKVVPSLTFI